MTNNLIYETSPYLLQHQNNPVDWQPWGAQAFAAAQAADKPIFLSIGYAACHWCHVMEAESFTDPATAALLNQYFIAVKVDREERPDVDAVYMSAVVAMTQSGGWPLSVWLTPQGVPFYGGTYFPPTPRYGRPSFRQVLQALANAWQNERTNLLQNAQQLHQYLQASQGLEHPASTNELSPQLLTAATQKIWQNFDWQNGGWGQAPKFPQPQIIRFLLAKHAFTKDPLAREMAERSLQQMAKGGIYDQLGGGFHRYSVDTHWLVPHFEKMLYDNAQLLAVYTQAYQLTQQPDYAQIAQHTAAYLLREMTHPAGGFYSSQDADSEGHEGKYFIWSLAEINAVLGDTAQQFAATYDVTATGNFEGNNIPNRLKSNQAQPATASPLGQACQRLLAQRAQRIPPATDDKILTAWNGLMIGALAQAGRVFAQPDLIEAAQRAAEFLSTNLRTPSGRWLRSWRADIAKLNGYLEDYAYLADGLLDLYQSTWQEHWFWLAYQLAEQLLTHFSAALGFYDTSHDHEALLVRPQDLQDNAIPSGNAMATTVLLRLAAYTGEQRFAAPAEALLAALGPALPQHPTAFGQWLYNYTLAVHGITEIAIIGSPSAPDTQALLQVVQQPYRPFQVVAVAADAAQSQIPLLQNRTQIDGKATAYVCQHFTCQQPTNDPQVLAQLIETNRRVTR